MTLRLELAPQTVQADQVPALVIARRDQALGQATRHAIAELRRLFNGLEHWDLLLRAASRPDGLAWLQDLTTSAITMREAMQVERKVTAELLAADQAERCKLDSGAFELVSIYAARIDGHRSQADVLAREREGLIASGLNGAEIDAVLAAREASGSRRQLREEAQAGIEAAEATIAALSAYLADPLRHLDKLPSELADELVGRAEAVRQRVANAHTISTTPVVTTA